MKFVPSSWLKIEICYQDLRNNALRPLPLKLKKKFLTLTKISSSFHMPGFSFCHFYPSSVHPSFLPVPLSPKSFMHLTNIDQSVGTKRVSDRGSSPCKGPQLRKLTMHFGKTMIWAWYLKGIQGIKDEVGRKVVARYWRTWLSVLEVLTLSQSL